MRYEYRCEGGHEFDQDFPIGTATFYVQCPNCLKLATRVRTWHTVAMHPNGTGGRHAE